MSLESRLRNELRTTPIVSPEPGLGQRALRQAARRRRAGRAGFAGAAAVVAAAVAVPLTVLHPGAQSSPAGAAPDTSVVVAAYDQSDDRAGSGYTHWVLNPSNGRYVQVKRIDGAAVRDLLVAPDGRSALVSRTESGCRDRQWGVIAVTDLVTASGSVHWLPCGPGGGSGDRESLGSVGAQWSRSGSKVLLAAGSAQSPAFRVYDVGQGQLSSSMGLPGPSAGRVLAWGRNDDEVATAPVDTGANRPGTIQLLSAADGHQVGSLAIRGGLFEDGDLGDAGFHRMQPLSADGQHRLDADGLLIDEGGNPRVTNPPADELEPAGWLDDQHYALINDDNPPAIWVLDRDGRVVKHQTLPVGRPGSGATVLPQFAAAEAYPGAPAIRF